MTDAIAVLDFGSQYAQLIARRVRESNVYSELFPCDAPEQQVMSINPKGIILSGGPGSVFQPGARQIPAYVLQSGLPILGICYGMQALVHALGGIVSASPEGEYGITSLEVVKATPFLPASQQQVLMSHGDTIEELPPGFTNLARTGKSPIAAMGDPHRNYYGLLFHPEVRHTQGGVEILRRFAIDICGAKAEWTPESIINQSVESIHQQVGTRRALAAVSGGVDSSVAAALVHRAIGDQLVAVFVDTGLLRKHEGLQVTQAFKEYLGLELIAVDARQEFMDALRGIIDPEEKRKIIGERFIRIFEAQARQLGLPEFLVQGTIYPDVVESRASDRSKADRIKTHHNVGGLPDQMQFELVEPLRYLFKDEVRVVGEALGLPPDLVWRQPFPGPGLAVRCLGEITPERLTCLRAADEILTSELHAAGLLNIIPKERLTTATATAQAFAVLLPVQSVGVMGDQRTYEEVIALRAVTTEDFMTADWARLPHDLLARIANRIVNEVGGVNRVVYDITAKPPATIEWE
ncbi:MAG: glutamine-hydrolyzing GMP synthase [Anaerolineales bacterium]